MAGVTHTINKGHILDVQSLLCIFPSSLTLGAAGSSSRTYKGKGVNFRDKKGRAHIAAKFLAGRYLPGKLFNLSELQVPHL